MNQSSKIVRKVFSVGVLLFSMALASSGCGSAKEAVDDFNSKNTCEDYCDKRFSCDNTEPTSDETDTCVSNCRSSMEDDCGNENQADATDKINECVDESCSAFTACMVFEAAPECFGFTD